MKYEFKSQVCTTKEQSERLLALGLKKETADMRWERISEKYAYYPSTKTPYASSDIPAWSLHRLLLLLLDNRCVAYDHISFSIDETDVFTKVINHIEWLIKEGYFNKEYIWRNSMSKPLFIIKKGVAKEVAMVEIDKL